MKPTPMYLITVMVLVIVIGGLVLLNMQYQDLLNHMNAQLKEATKQLNEDAATMKRYRETCHIQQTAYRQ